MPKLTAESSGHDIKGSATFVKYQKYKFEIFAFVFLAILASFILFYNLGAMPVQGYDEGFYALMAKDTGLYGAIPKINGVVWLQKPPLGVWFIALSSHVLGYSAFSLRLPSVIFAVGSILLLFLLGKKIASLWTGFFAALIFLISPIFLHPYHMARSGDLDTMMLFATIAAFLFYVYSWKNPKMLVVSGAMIGLGFMLRGSPILIIGFIIVLHAIITRKHQSAPFKYWILWIVAAGAIAIPWHLYALVTHPSEFINFYIHSNFFGRIFSVVDEHSGSALFYHDFIKQQLGSLFIFLYIAIIWLLKKSWKGDSKSLLILLWIIVPIAVLSIMETKTFWYVIPMLPAIFLSIAILVKDILNSRFPNFITFIAFFVQLFWLLNIPANIAGWELEQRITVLEILLVLSLIIFLFSFIKRFRKYNLSISQIFMFLIIIVFAYNGAIVSAKTILSPIQDPSIKLIAEIGQKKGAKNILVSSQEHSWPPSWLSPQAGYYLNVEYSLQAQYVQTESLIDKIEQTKSRWIIADQSAFQLLQTHYESPEVVFRNDNIFFVELK